MASTDLVDFVSIFGGQGHFTLQNYFVVTLGIVKGEVYAFRYRGINVVGEGQWSDTVLVRAATKPIAPPAPYYVSSTSSTITLGLDETSDNSGSKITSYKIMRDAGDLQSDISIEETSYNGFD